MSVIFQKLTIITTLYIDFTSLIPVETSILEAENHTKVGDLKQIIINSKGAWEQNSVKCLTGKANRRWRGGICRSNN